MTFAFAHPELEARFQSHNATAVSFLSWVIPGIMVTGFIALLLQMYGRGSQFRHLLPDLVLPLLGQFLPAVTALTLLAYFPKLFCKYRRAVSLALGVGCMIAYHDLRQIQLWLRYVTQGRHGTLLTELQGFMSENVYLTIMAPSVIGFPAGPVLDAFVVTGILAASLAGTAATCASPLWPADPVTTSPIMLAAARSVTSVLVDFALPGFPRMDGRLSACPAALAFWQVAGSWLALTAALVMAVTRRAAFLRTNEAQAWLFSKLGPASLQWPVGSYLIREKIVPALFLLTLAHIAALVIALELFRP